MFPLSKPLRLPTDSLKDPLPTLASKDTTHNIISSSGDSGTKSHTQLQANSSQHILKLPRKKVSIPVSDYVLIIMCISLSLFLPGPPSLPQLLNRRSCNVLLKQSSGKSLAIAHNDRFPQETANATSQLTVSDSEIM